MADSSVQAVSAAIFGRLNVASLKGAYPTTGVGCVGGVTDAPGSQGLTFPLLWYEVASHDIGGLGQGPDLAQLELRLHVFSTYSGMSEAQRVMDEAIRLLKYTTPTAAGYRMVQIGRPTDEIPLPFEVLNGVAVRELVTIWDLFAEDVSWVQGGWIQGGWIQAA